MTNANNLSLVSFNLTILNEQVESDISICFMKENKMMMMMMGCPRLVSSSPSL